MRTEAEVRANLQALDAGPDPELLAAVRRLLEKVQDIEWTSGLPENNPPSAISV
jgi:hypothetical protein